jgi:hypothetical protein
MTSIPFKMHECHEKGLVADDTVGMTLPSEVFFEHPIPWPQTLHGPIPNRALHLAREHDSV